MKTLFETRDRDDILRRLDALKPSTPRQWGKMDAAQMLTHCSIAMEASTGDRPSTQLFIGKILAPFVKKSLLSDTPFEKSAPTGRALIVADQREFAAEHARLADVIRRFGDRGPEKADQAVHGFLGPLAGSDWGRIQHKHLDHHLRQFGV